MPGEEITRLWQKISSAKERKSVPEGEKPRLYKQEIQSEICETLLKWISMFCDRAEYRKLKYFSDIEEDLFVEGNRISCPPGYHSGGGGVRQNLLFLSA